MILRCKVQRLNHAGLVVDIAQTLDADNPLVLRNPEKRHILFGRKDQILIENHVGRFFPFHGARARKADIAGSAELFLSGRNKRTSTVRANQNAVVYQLRERCPDGNPADVEFLNQHKLRRQLVVFLPLACLNSGQQIVRDLTV